MPHVGDIVIVHTEAKEGETASKVGIITNIVDGDVVDIAVLEPTNTEVKRGAFPSEVDSWYYPGDYTG